MSSTLEQFADLRYGEMHECVYDAAPENEQKQGTHDIRTVKCYPAFPWKQEEGVSHIEDDPVFFGQVAEKAGKMQFVRAADKQETEKPITYEEWVKRHENEPGWVNNLEGESSVKRMEDL